MTRGNDYKHGNIPGRRGNPYGKGENRRGNSPKSEPTRSVKKTPNKSYDKPARNKGIE